MKRGKRVFIFAMMLVIAVGCASQKNHKKLKPGKPIPCPQKDC